MYRLKVSSYDQVSSMLLALVGLLGVVVTILLLVWLTSQIFLTQAAVPVELIELGNPDVPLSESMELEGPLDEEIEMQEPSAMDTLAAVADAVATNAALLDNPSLSNSENRGRGGGGGGGTRAEPARRWEVFFEGNSLEVYAKQLDSFGIELGVLMPGNEVRYASNLSKSKPDTRTGPADEEKRYYLTWRGGELQQADRELLSRAAIDSSGRIILKFLPPAVEATLQALEKRHQGSDPGRGQKTRFGIRPQGDGFAFFVID